MWLTTRPRTKESGNSTNGIWNKGATPRSKNIKSSLRGSTRTLSLDSLLDDVEEEVVGSSRHCHSSEQDCVPPLEHLDYDEDGDGDTSIMTSQSSHDSNENHDEFSATTARTELSYDASSLTTFELKKQTTKRVQFSTVEVREYARCACDNPAVSGGVPIGLDWKVVAQHTSVPLDKFEAYRPWVHHDQVTRIANLRLTGVEREEVLRGHCGLSSADLRNMEYRVAVTRMQREATAFILQRQARQRQFFHRLVPKTMLPTQNTR